LHVQSLDSKGVGLKPEAGKPNGLSKKCSGNHADFAFLRHEFCIVKQRVYLQSRQNQAAKARGEYSMQRQIEQCVMPAHCPASQTPQQQRLMPHNKTAAWPPHASGRLSHAATAGIVPAISF
jgi:hypothetical protein